MSRCPAFHPAIRTARCALPEGHEGAHMDGVEPWARVPQDDALAAAEAVKARYRAGIRAALRALHAVHASLPDGDSVPRQSADALALAVEGALLAALGGEA